MPDQSALNDHYAPRRLIVAVVDDDPAVCNSLKFSLELEGFSVFTFGNAADFLNSGVIGFCDCFVIDQRMPEITGLELIDMLRERKLLTPAILIVSHPSDATRVRASTATACIVEKPLLGNTLVERINAACHLRGCL